MRLALVVLSLVGLAAAAPMLGAPRPTAAAASFEKAVRPFVARHCARCHGSTVKSGGLDLQALRAATSITSHRSRWERVLQKLVAGQMPPPGAPRPPAAEVKAVTGWLSAQFARADGAAPPNPGRVTARRLNRGEYNNSVRDLLAVDLRPADDFPQDDSGYGFDNIGDVLSLSPVLMEKYLAAAERLARAALFGPEPVKPTLTQLRVPGRRIEPAAKALRDYDETGLTLPNALHALHRFPVEGEYAVRVILGGQRPAASEPLRIALWSDGEKVAERAYDPEGVASFEIDWQELGGQATDFRARFAGGEQWLAVSFPRMFEGLPASYEGPNPSQRPPPRPPDFTRGLPPPPPDATPEQLAEYQRRLEARRQRMLQRMQERPPANGARVNYLEITGPYDQPKGPSEPSLRKIYTCGHLRGGHGKGCAGRIVADFARRAFRRPLLPAETEQYLRLVDTARRQGDSLEEGICLAIQAILVSPHFLFRIERDRSLTPGAAHPVSQHELAARLSYFLWSSTPDDELLTLADRGALRKPEVLAAQVNRLLKDPRSRALVENFGGQWLEVRKLESVKPDRERFPQWDEYLRLSMRQETERFFEHLAREDRSILEFLDAPYTFLNERLARFYGIPGVSGPEFRKVALPAGERGGVLAQASVLTVSSYATRTSPVLRGRWILENLLNSPPPPPPPDVPNLDEAAIGTSATLRAQLEQHRTNSTCASCHARMDPLGFALENYDAIGAWRAQDGRFPVDASGALPDGRAFNGPDGLKALLKADREAFARCLTEKLLTYSLGRGLEAYDRRAVNAIAAGLPASGYRFSSLVLGIVNCLPFQQRKGERRG